MPSSLSKAGDWLNQMIYMHISHPEPLASGSGSSIGIGLWVQGVSSLRRQIRASDGPRVLQIRVASVMYRLSETCLSFMAPSRRARCAWPTVFCPAVILSVVNYSHKNSTHCSFGRATASRHGELVGACSSQSCLQCAEPSWLL